MKPPTRRRSLVEEGLRDTVVRQRMNGQDATHHQPEEQQHDRRLESTERIEEDGAVRFVRV